MDVTVDGYRLAEWRVNRLQLGIARRMCGCAPGTLRTGMHQGHRTVNLKARQAPQPGESLFSQRFPGGRRHLLYRGEEEMAAATREALGEERLAWLRGLPRLQIHGAMALVHASPESPWRAPAHTAGDAELESVYAPLGQPVAIYGHIHRSYIRSVAGMTVANTGSVSLSYDGDRRAAYLLLDESKPTIRRVEYDVDREIRALSGCGLPYADWVAKILDSGRFQAL